MVLDQLGFELDRMRRRHNDMTGLPALHAVDQIIRPQHPRSRNDHRTELHRGENRLPQLDLVAEHDDDPVTAGDAMLAQPVRHLVRARTQLGEGAPGLAAVRLDNPQRQPIPAVPRDRVEPNRAPS